MSLLILNCTPPSLQSLILGTLLEESVVDPLLDDDEGESGIVVGGDLSEGCLDLDDFVFHDES